MKLLNLVALVALVAVPNFVDGTAVVAPRFSPFSSTNDKIDGYEIGVATFTGEINGVPYAINGTVENVLYELKQKHPDVDWVARGKNATLDEGSNVAAWAKMERSVLSKNSPNCLPVGNWGWKMGAAANVQQCIDLMYQVKGQVGVAHNSCVRACCIGQGLVTLCNDRPDYIHPNFDYIGSYAGDICSKCRVKSWFPFIHSWDSCGGQQFDTDGYNVIVRHPWGPRGANGDCADPGTD